MIIGFDASRAFVAGKTGTENYSYQLLKWLLKIDKKNHYVIYLDPYRLNPKSEILNSKQITNSNDQNNKRLENLIFEHLGLFSASKLEFRNYEVRFIYWPRLWTQAGLAIQTFKDNLDVLFVPAHTLPLIRKPGLKTVVTVHDLGSEYLPSMHQLKQRLYLGLMQNYQLKTASKIIAVSEATKKDLVKRMGIDPKKISVVYEGYDEDKFKVHPSTSLGTRSSKFKVNQIIKHYNLQYQNYFLFVGTVQPRKNLERLIKSFNQFCHPEERLATKDLLRMQESSDKLRDSSAFGLRMTKKNTQNDKVKLVIAGSKGWLSDEIYKLPKKLGIDNRVKFLGYVPEEDLPALYSGALAFTFPSLFEGFGLPILEAQACGCPVLTSNVSSMPEVAGKGAILVNPYSEGDIVEGIERVKSQESRVKVIEAGLQNAKRFSWEKCALQTLSVFEETLNSKS